MKNLFNRPNFKRRLRKRKYQKRKSRNASNHGSRINLNLETSYVWGIRVALIILVVGIIGLLISGVRAYFLLDFPGETSWNGDDNLNILVVGLDEKNSGYKFIDSIILLHASPKDEKIGILAIDPDISFLHDGETLTFQKSYNVVEGGDRDFSLLKKGLDQSLALQVDKYIALDEESFLEVEEFFSPVKINFSQDQKESDYEEIVGDFWAKEGTHSYKGKDLLASMATDEFGTDKRLDTQGIVLDSLLGNFASFKFSYKLLTKPRLLNGLQTDLSKREALDLYMFLRKGNKIETKLSYTKQNSLMLLDTKKTEKGVVWERVAQDIQAVFLDERILQEQVRLEVLNGTSEAGLAGRYKRNFENSGLRVVREDNSLTGTDKTTLYLGEFGEKEYTINFIKSVFGDKIQVEEEDYRYKHIGDMVLVLGTNLVGAEQAN